MQPKVNLLKKKELVARMISSDFTAMEKENYLEMLSKYTDLFITSYEEI